MTAFNAAPQVQLAVRRYVLRAVDEVHLPMFSGSTVRGAVGRALRRLVCATRLPVCEGCPVRSACAYAMLHDGFTPSDRPSGFGEHAPPPLWLRDLEAGRKLGAGDEMAFSVVAFGPAVASLPYVDEAVRGLGRSGLGRGRGGVTLVDVQDEQRSTLGALVEARVDELSKAVSAVGAMSAMGGLSNGGATGAVGVATGATGAMGAMGSLRVRLRSPVSIRLKGRAWADPSRPKPSWAERLLGGAVRRRVALERRWLELSSEEAPRVPRVVEDAAGLKVMEENIEVRRVKRFSSTQGGPVELHGVVGEVRLGGDGLQAALPWLVAGELLSVGAGTTFGFGRIDLEAA